MSSTVTLTGVLPFVILVASGLALPVSFLLLRLYRRAVQKGMISAGSGQGEIDQAAPTPHRPPAQLRIVEVGARSTPVDTSPRESTYGRALYGPWRASGAYAIAGLAYALIMTAGWLAATRDEAIVWIKVLVLFWTYYWPAVLTTLLVAAYDPRRRLQLLGAYFVVLGALVAIAVARNPGLGIGALPLYWILMNVPSSLLLATFLIRPIRAVGPLVLTFLIAIAIGSQILVSAAAANERLLRGIAELGFALGLNAAGVFFGMMIVGLVGFALLGWPLLRLIGRRYERKLLSDQSITLDALWLMFGVTQSIGLAFEGPLWVLTGIVAFVAYKTIVLMILRRLAARSSVQKSKTLLLLRVFALGKRSEQLFDRLRKHWQYAGSISMIAGPDLVTATVEPHEFLGFLSGDLGRQFVSDKQDLGRRVAHIDKAPDPDGRYRVNEFFCHSNTWQMTMERLAADSDAVIMDLRSFSPANQGCVFELGRLVDGVDLERVVFLADGTTDRDFLDSVLRRLWESSSAASPNQSVAQSTARIFRIERRSEKELKALLRLLLGTI
jgi:hypothetical protein